MFESGIAAPNAKVPPLPENYAWVYTITPFLGLNAFKLNDPLDFKTVNKTSRLMTPDSKTPLVSQICLLLRTSNTLMELELPLLNTGNNAKRPPDVRKITLLPKLDPPTDMFLWVELDWPRSCPLI